MNNQIRDISWRQLTGNKVVKSLHPAMLLDCGYHCVRTIRAIGESHRGIFNVKYDRDYVIAYLASKVIRPLENEGLEGIQKLIDYAWKHYKARKKRDDALLVRQHEEYMQP